MDKAMDFELTMSLFFGEKAYQIAGQEANPKHRREWLQKAVRKLLRKVNTLDTTPHHKQALMSQLDKILNFLRGANDPSWVIIYCFFRLSFCLLGFGHTPIYYQTAGQYYTAHILRGGDVMQDYYDQKDAIALRRSVVEDLKKQGLDDFKISLVLNTSEYEIKQLRSNSDIKRKLKKPATD